MARILVFDIGRDTYHLLLLTDELWRPTSNLFISVCLFVDLDDNLWKFFDELMGSG